jgi:hypothetical protein
MIWLGQHSFTSFYSPYKPIPDDIEIVKTSTKPGTSRKRPKSGEQNYRKQKLLNSDIAPFQEPKNTVKTKGHLVTKMTLQTLTFTLLSPKKC